MHSIVLMGIKHCGKSSLGRRLADEDRMSFRDLDDLIEIRYRADRLLSCREIYKRHGREHFMDLEAEAALLLREELISVPTVAALGGGTGENEDAMKHLSLAGVLVYLCDSEAALFSRIMQRGLPSFLPEHGTEAAFHNLYDRRNRLYSGYADITVEIDGMNIDDAYSHLRAKLGEHSHVGQ